MHFSFMVKQFLDDFKQFLDAFITIDDSRKRLAFFIKFYKLNEMLDFACYYFQMDIKLSCRNFLAN